MTAPREALEPDGLDAELVGWLAQGLSPLPVDVAVAQRVKRQVLQRIADDQRPSLRTVQPQDGTWRAAGPGLSIKALYRMGSTLSYLLRMDPGAILPAHRHPQDEECVVLAGSVCIGELALGPGAFHMAGQGSLHAPIISPDGATLFLRGAAPELAQLL